MREVIGADWKSKVRPLLERVRQSRIALRALLAGIALVLVGLAFWAGITVGAAGGRHAAQPPGSFFGRPIGGPRGQIGHGAFGSITNINGNSITIMDSRFGEPRIISIGQGTLIERGNRQRVSVGELRVGENITVIGSPASGNVIQARFIGVGQGSPMNFEWHRAPPRFSERGSGAAAPLVADEQDLVD